VRTVQYMACFAACDYQALCEFIISCSCLGQLAEVEPAGQSVSFCIDCSHLTPVQEADAITEPAEREAAEKRVRMRTLGTVRLIAELYRKDVVKEMITLVCIRELLQGKGPKVGGGQPQAVGGSQRVRQRSSCCYTECHRHSC
jgi:hypothetical protein